MVIIYCLSDIFDTPIQYLYCRCQITWYWSFDGVVWQREDMLTVQDGKHKCKRPNNEDLNMIALMKRCKTDPHPDTMECESCNNYSKVPYV